MTTCDRCGTRIRGRRLCDPCAKADRENNTTGGEANTEPDAVTVECAESDCNRTYEHPTHEKCPDCGSRRRRAASSELRADGGNQ